MGAWLRCKKCGDYIRSLFRHDWQSCFCGAIFVDGGDDYMRYGGNPEDIEQVVWGRGETANTTGLNPANTPPSKSGD